MNVISRSKTVRVTLVNDLVDHDLRSRLDALGSWTSPLGLLDVPSRLLDTVLFSFGNTCLGLNWSRWSAAVTGSEIANAC
jgi:hypothetical protein